MTRYLSLAVLAVLLLFAGCASHGPDDSDRSGGPGRPGGSEAQGGPGGPATVEQRAAELKTLLKLSDEQAAAVLPILREQDEQRKALMDGARSAKRDDEAMQQKMADLEWDTDKKLALVLTEDQMVAYSKWRDDQAAKQQERPEPPSGGKPGGQPPRRF